MTFEIKVSRQANAEINIIFNWIANRSKPGAEKWYNTFLQVLRSLEENATNCGSAPEAEELGLELREVPLKTRRGNIYRIVFLIGENKVQIISVRGAGQDLLHRDDIQPYS